MGCIGATDTMDEMFNTDATNTKNNVTAGDDNTVDEEDPNVPSRVSVKNSSARKTFEVKRKKEMEQRRKRYVHCGCE